MALRWLRSRIAVANHIHHGSTSEHAYQRLDKLGVAHGLGGRGGQGSLRSPRIAPNNDYNYSEAWKNEYVVGRL